MSQNPNQFLQTPEKGQVDLRQNPSVFSCMVKTGVSTPLVPGQAVMLSDVAGKEIRVEAITADTDPVFGFVAYNQKSNSFIGDEALEIIGQNSVIYLEAGAAVTPGANLMPVVTGSKVITATTGKTTAAMALDKAAADGDLIRAIVNVLPQIVTS